MHGLKCGRKKLKKNQGNGFNLAQIKFLRRRVYLYINMGLLEAAQEDLAGALELTYQTHNEELFNLLLIDLKLYADRN